MLLVDEPLRHAMYGSKVDNAVAKQASGPEPFQGGYADFIRHDSLEDARKAPAPPRTSMFDDLCFYYRNHSKHLELTQSPGSVTLFAQKIIASEYLLLLGYYRFVLNHLSWTLTRQHSLGAFDVGRVERAWSDLQAYHRRLMDHHHNVGLLITALQLPRESKPATYHTNQPNPWKDTAPDFLHIETELERLKQHAEGLQNSFTSLAGIVVSRQSLDEARSVRVLTVLGMTFLPMSLVAGLLSMGGDYLAGETRFWVYWAASIPSVFLVFGLSWLAVHVLGVLSV
jgi:Mg2+ and Co2+ transporter CorA